MTPREKGKEIVGRFKESCKNDIFSDWDYVYKRNALIAVDLLIEEQTMWQNGQCDPVLYWQDVRKEIEKL